MLVWRLVIFLNCFLLEKKWALNTKKWTKKWIMKLKDGKRLKATGKNYVDKNKKGGILCEAGAF